MNAKPTFIYTLSDPRTGFIRYVGKTQQLRHRYLVHKNGWGRGNHRVNWINSLLKLGLLPLMEVVEGIPPSGDWAEAERFWIETFRFYGFDLTNLTRGGEGVPGVKQTEYAKEVARKYWTGRKHTEATKAKISAVHKGRKLSPERIEALRISSSNWTEERRKSHGEKSRLAWKTSPKFRAFRKVLKNGLRRGHKLDIVQRLQLSLAHYKCPAKRQQVLFKIFELKNSPNPEVHEARIKRTSRCLLFT